MKSSVDKADDIQECIYCHQKGSTASMSRKYIHKEHCFEQFQNKGNRSVKKQTSSEENDYKYIIFLKMELM